MNTNQSNGLRSSKKRRKPTLRPRVKRHTPYDTLTIQFPDGSIKVSRPNMTFFDGDWKLLALSLCEGHRITWTLS